MSAVLKVLEPGLQTTIQDFGRPGLLRHGVPRSGAVDRVRLQLGNALVGNSPGEAALEVRMIGPTLQAEGGPVRLGLAGEMTAEILRSDGDLVSLVPWQSLLLQPGDQLRKVRLTGGCTGYLCVAGGLDLSPVLGSVASYRYARLGGLGDGAALTGGAVLALRQSPDPSAQDKCLTAPLEEKASQLRVIFGPQDQHFAPDTLARFAQEPFLVSHQADRMGVRLVGQAVHPLPGAAGSMRSDGSVPGAIQVPGSGEPVILGAD
ncbi:MAG: biotin-dependent carboxyltransferase family protein, partial [Rhodospirillaceae bacterium]